MFDELDRVTGTKPSKQAFLRAPFGYPGGKSRSISFILPHLPYRAKYVEPFGGSGAVLLARRPSPVEVYNDRYGGVVDFYRCIRNPALFEKLVNRLELTPHAIEEFVDCKNWNAQEDLVERAARWYAMVQMSFGSLGRNFGRSLGSGGGIAGKIQNKLPKFNAVHRRMRTVQIENEDWEETFDRYDAADAVFYCDPPYADTSKGVYKDEMNDARHREFLARVFSCKGFVAVSGYSNSLYENQDWSARHEWSSYVSIQSTRNTEANFKPGIETARGNAQEVLWVKK